MSEDSPAGPANAKAAARRLEDRDAVRARLSDTSFSFNRFPDPLAPAGSVPKKYPPGTNAQLEQEWLAMIDSAVKR